MFFNLPTLSLGGLLGVGDLASTPVVSGLRHPAGTPPVTAAQTQLPSRTKASGGTALREQGRRYSGPTHGPFSHPARHGTPGAQNETFQTLKKQGYHLEHNYGHGKEHLSSTLAGLMLLSFLFDQVHPSSTVGGVSS